MRHNTTLTPTMGQLYVTGSGITQQTPQVTGNDSLRCRPPNSLRHNSGSPDCRVWGTGDATRVTLYARELEMEYFSMLHNLQECKYSHEPNLQPTMTLSQWKSCVHNLLDVSFYPNNESLHRRRKHRRRD